MIKFQNNDVVFNKKNNFDTNNHSEDVLQRIKFKIMLDKGEWFLNKTMGIPWTSEIMPIKNWELQKNMIEKEVKKVLLEDKDVDKIISLDISLDPGKRMVNIYFKIKCKNGETLEMEVGQ